MKPLIILIIISLLLSTLAYAETNEQYYYNIIKLYSKQYNVDPYIIFKIAKHESRFNPNLIGITNDLGIMQLNPNYISYWKKEMDWKGVFNWNDPHHNIQMGTFIYKSYLSHTNGDTNGALTLYNAGYRYLNNYGYRLVYIHKVLGKKKPSVEVVFDR